jgi:hypothetical protein
MGPEMLQSWSSAVQRGQEQCCAVAAGHIGRMYHRPNDCALGIDQQVARAALDLRAPIIAPGPPTSVVFTAGLSMIAVLSGGSRQPSRGRPDAWPDRLVPRDPGHARDESRGTPFSMAVGHAATGAWPSHCAA